MDVHIDVIYKLFSAEEREREKEREQTRENDGEEERERTKEREREILEECARCCVPAYVCVRAKEIRARMRGERKLEKREK